ncbi:MAG: hypothetical protein KIT84_41940 [Labilithrix sp.]|nr:hypothetical protein [Labilithrix sp.]MCW5817636.1 hypothetical protein [Labilithrix sp.]
MKRASALLVAAALFAGAAHAEAAPTSAQKAGRAHFKKGVELYRKGAYAPALAEFKEAYARAPSPVILFNIGQACAELKDYVCAYTTFEKYAATPGVPRAKKATAREEVKRLTAHVAYLNITTSVDGAAVTVDDAPVGTSPLPGPVLVAAGRRTVAASKDALFPARQALDVPGDLPTVDVKLDLVEPPAPPPAKVLFVTKPAPPQEEKSRLPLWLGLGTTGAFAATTTVLGILTLSAKSELLARSERFGITQGDLAAAQSYQNGLALGTDIALGATLLAAGITTVILLLR